MYCSDNLLVSKEWQSTCENQAKFESRTAPDREVVDDFFSAAAAVAAAVGALSLSSPVAVVVLTGVTGAVAFIVTVVLANDETACLGVVVVLVGVGFCAVETAGLAVNFDGAEGLLDGPTLEGLGGATVAAGGRLVAGVGGEVVDTALATAGFS